MELIILLAVARWFSGIARGAGRSPSGWGMAGATAYLLGLFASALIVGPLLGAASESERPVLSFILYETVINTVGMALAHFLCREVFDQNLTTMRSLARTTDVGAIVIALLFLMPPLIGLFVTGRPEMEEIVSALPMALVFVILVPTLFVLRNDREGITVAVWPAYIVLSANAALMAALLWYGRTLVLSRPSTLSIISASMFSWAVVAAGLSALCVGLTILSSRRLRRG